MTRWLALVLTVACGSACIDMDEPDSAEPPAASSRTLRDGARASRVLIDHDMAPAPDPDVCTLLPPSGACSLACDPAALGEQYLPPNTCGVFLCELTDGQHITVHACHHGN